MMTILLVKELGFRLEHKWLWKDLNLELFEGDKLMISGSSGSGKTMFLRALSSLDPIQKGKVFFKGQALLDMKLPFYRSKVMYFHQLPTFNEGTVLDNLLVPFDFKVHYEKSFNQDKVVKLLMNCGRSRELLQREVQHLSGGERQIIALIRGLQLEPEVLLLDEPTASLDQETTQQIETLIQIWLRENAERCFVWVSHDQAQLQRLGNRFLEL